MGTRQIYKFMSVCTQSVGREETLDRAHALMREHHIHHLPVLDRGVLVGIVTAGDLRCFETLDGVDPALTRVEDAMTAEPYFVEPSALLADVARRMTEQKYGCAIVMDGPNVVGMFTSTDGLRALATVLGAADASPNGRELDA